jgi:hypothetical protein
MERSLSWSFMQKPKWEKSGPPSNYSPMGIRRNCELPMLKQRVARRLLPKPKPSAQRELWENTRQRFWQRRYYDFKVYSDRKVTEKLRYMHRNPVGRGLVPSPELRRWSSYRAFAFCEEGMVKLNWQGRSTNGNAKAVAARDAADSIAAHPPNVAEGRAPTSSFRQRKSK